MPAKTVARKAAKAKAPGRKVAKSAKGAKTAKPAKPRGAKPKGLKGAKAAFGRPGTAGKADGDAAVRAWIDGVKPEHQDIVRRVDALLGRTVPGVQRAVKWSMPMYGVAGKGWIAHMGSFKDYVAVGFFAGTDLRPLPPEGGESGRMRRVNLHGMQKYDERQLRDWLVQAAAMPGWGKV